MRYLTRSGVLPERLDAGEDADLVEALHHAAARLPVDLALNPDQAIALVQSLPGWTALARGQAERIATLERALADLGDRPSHDPTLSASVHEVLSAVTAIRATDSILAGQGDISSDRQAWFHRISMRIRAAYRATRIGSPRDSAC